MREDLKKDLEKAQEYFKQWKENEELEVKEVWDALPYDIRLACTAYVFERLNDHLKGSGTFRYLIYDRLGFESDAYAILYCAGGMNLSNAFHDVRDMDKQEEE